MALEFLAEQAPPSGKKGAYECAILDGDAGDPLRIDWGPLIQQALADRHKGKPRSAIARGFHEALAEAIVAVAKRLGLERVILSGGCFQNKLLTEQALRRLREEGFRPFSHERIPPGDGGLALGQVAAALWQDA
jgi:hydrogenase maturation protein HypF